MSGNYLRALLKIAPTLPAGFVTINVLHDDWCAFFAGGACDCDPELVPVKVTP
jgi:hypothetical protein